MFGDKSFQRLRIHIAFERVIGIKVVRLGAGKVDRLAADEIDIAARRIEVCVVGHDLTGLDHDAEQYVFGSTALVRGYYLFKAEDVLDGVSKAIPASRTCVGLVAAHQGTPCIRGHRAGARISQQVDDHVFGTQEESIVVGIPNQIFAFLARGELDWLHHFDPERFDYRLHVAHFGCSGNCLK